MRDYLLSAEVKVDKGTHFNFWSAFFTGVMQRGIKYLLLIMVQKRKLFSHW
jgi:hypothetical protein